MLFEFYCNIVYVIYHSIYFGGIEPSNPPKVRLCLMNYNSPGENDIRVKIMKMLNEDSIKNIHRLIYHISEKKGANRKTLMLQQ